MLIKGHPPVYIARRNVYCYACLGTTLIWQGKSPKAGGGWLGVGYKYRSVGEMLWSRVGPLVRRDVVGVGGGGFNSWGRGVSFGES